jgi:hypothetical protein
MARRPQKPDEPALLDQLSGPLRDFVQDFKTHGKSVLEKVRERSPEKYLELSTKLAGLVAALKPKQNELEQANSNEDIAISLLKSVGCDESKITEDMILKAWELNNEFVGSLESIAAAAKREDHGNDQARDFRLERKAFRRYIEGQGL